PGRSSWSSLSAMSSSVPTRERSAASAPQASSRKRARSSAGRERAASSSASRRDQPAASFMGGSAQAGELGPQQGAGARPVPLHGAQRDAQRLARLLLGEAAEVTALEHLGQAGIALAQAQERAVEVEDLLGVRVHGHAALVERERGQAAAALGPEPGPGA